MKRLDSYLLTHHPLLWNLRVHIIWPVILGLHIIFFLWGYGSASFPGTEHYQRIYPGGDIATFSVLLSLLAGVLWLLLYFRNNAFKTFLPLRRGRLVSELLLVFATCFGIVTVSMGYSVGKVLHLRQMTSAIVLREEKNVATMAEPFLPFQLNDFSRFNDCEHNSNQANSTDDSGRLPTDTFSYLHYCENSYREYTESMAAEKTTKDSIYAVAKRWLLRHEGDSIQQALEQYLSLVKKYGGTYRFKVEEHVSSMFGTPNMELRYVIPTVALEYESAVATEATTVNDLSDAPKQAPNLTYGEKPAYIEARNVDEALALIVQVRNASAELVFNVLTLYFALVLTILIFSFRITSMRPWLIAVLGAGLWMVAVGLLVAVIHGGIGSLILVVMLQIGFTILAVVSQRAGWARRWAGVMLLWSLGASPLVLPCLWSVLRDATYPDNSYVNGIPVYKQSPFHEFLNDYQSVAMYGNVFLVLVLIAAFYIPLARKWQAMPEE